MFMARMRMKQMEVLPIMNNQSKQMVINALIKVVDSAPYLCVQMNSLYSQQQYQVRDVSMQEYNTWIDYANQVLDISYNHIGLNAILTTKLSISQLNLQYGMLNLQRIEQVKQMLLQLVQIIIQC